MNRNTIQSQKTSKRKPCKAFFSLSGQLGNTSKQSVLRNLVLVPSLIFSCCKKNAGCFLFSRTKHSVRCPASHKGFLQMLPLFSFANLKVFPPQSPTLFRWTVHSVLSRLVSFYFLLRSPSWKSSLQFQDNKTSSQTGEQCLLCTPMQNFFSKNLKKENLHNVCCSLTACFTSSL